MAHHISYFEKSLRLETETFYNFVQFREDHSIQIADWKRKTGKKFNPRFPISNSDCLGWMMERITNV